VQAIVNGKLDNTIARAALEGKITVEDIKAVDKAHAEVKKEIGAKAYKEASVEDLAKMVDDKVGVVKKEMQDNLRESEELHSFENKVNDFVERTPDFPDYAKEIETWLDNHEDITDIEVAYYAVKGQLSGQEAVKKADEERAEYAKNMAANAGGGGHRSNFIAASEGDLIDSLISPRSNPNRF
jgi:predicted phage tail protein